MVWACGKIGLVSYSQKGVDGRSRGRVQGSTRLGWMDSLKMAFGSRGMAVEADRQWAKNRKESRALGRMHVTEGVSRRHFCLALCSFLPPFRALVVITWRGKECNLDKL